MRMYCKTTFTQRATSLILTALMAATIALVGAVLSPCTANADASAIQVMTVSSAKKPAKPVIASISAQAKSIAVSWGKVAGASGYQVSCSTYSAGTGKIVSTSSGVSSKQLTGLKGGKKYYVKVRAYKVIKGKKAYSTWSKWRSVTTKKSVTTATQTSSGGGTVYITDTGKKYHYAGCSSLRKSKYAISLASAKAQGYTPCQRCC